MTILHLALGLGLVFAQTIGEVESVADRNVDFAAYQTYAWSQGREADDPAVHKLIVDAIDGEMARQGLTKADARVADVTIQYRSVRGSYLDEDALKKSHKEGWVNPSDPEILVSLVVQLRPAGRTDPVWEARTRRVLSDTPAAQEREIRSAIAALFRTYGRTKKEED